MDDLNRILAQSLHDAAGDAPDGAGLLGDVHARSRRYRKRRVVTATALSAAVAVAVAGIPIVTMLTTRPKPVLPPAASRPAVVAVPSSPTPSSTPPASSKPSIGSSSSPSSAHTSPAAGAVTLSKGWTAPTFPYTLPATDGMSAPVASLADGNPSAFFEATELRKHADITITVSTEKPSFTTAAQEIPFVVRGHGGYLRTVDVSPAKQLTLYWKESSTRWIRLATDDTYTPEQVVELAESMTSASIAVPPPFDLDLSPDGLIADSVTASRMIFRSPDAAPGSGGFSTVLHQHQQLTGVNKKVNGYDAVLTHTAGQANLAVDATDWNATLRITVGNGLTVSDADLLRYAAGVHILNRSNPE